MCDRPFYTLLPTLLPHRRVPTTLVDGLAGVFGLVLVAHAYLMEADDTICSPRAETMGQRALVVDISPASGGLFEVRSTGFIFEVYSPKTLFVFCFLFELDECLGLCAPWGSRAVYVMLGLGVCLTFELESGFSPRPK